MVLAFTGTFLAYLVTGWLTHLFLDLPLQTALVFGALMAPTDPVSVISVFKSLGVNRRLAVIMEGESLINRVSPPVFMKLEKENNERIEQANRQLDELYKKHPELLQEQEFTARKKLLYAEHQAVEKLLGEGILSEEAGDERKRRVLERIESLENKERF